MKNGADINVKNNYGETALILAMDKGHIKVAKYLITHNANVNATTLHGRNTALIWASRDGRLEIVKMLILKGANVHARNSEGVTAREYATIDGVAKSAVHKKIIDLLKKNEKTASLDFDKVQSAANNDLLTAVYKGNIEAVKRAYKQGADVKAKKF